MDTSKARWEERYNRDHEKSLHLIYQNRILGTIHIVTGSSPRKYVWFLSEDIESRTLADSEYAGQRAVRRALREMHNG